MLKRLKKLLKRRFFQGIILILLLASCALFYLLRPVTEKAISMSQILYEPENQEANAILFYAEEDTVFVRLCTQRIINAMEDCPSNDFEIILSLESFKDKLKAGLKILRFADVQEEFHRKIHAYGENHRDVLNIGRDYDRHLQEKVDFVEQYGDESVMNRRQRERFHLLKESLTSLEKELTDWSEYDLIVDEINHLIENLIDQLFIRSFRKVAHRNHQGQESYMFDLLRGFLTQIKHDVVFDSEFVTIPRGSFQYVKGGRITTITEDFQVMAHEVTQRQYAQVMQNNPSFFSQERYCPNSYTVENSIPMCPHNPVENISVQNIRDFLSKVNANKPPCNVESLMNGPPCYRLLKPSEWGLSVRRFHLAKTYDYLFPPQNILERSINPIRFTQQQKVLNEMEWWKSNSEGHTQPVTSLSRNMFHLYNMLGNVGEVTFYKAKERRENIEDIQILGCHFDCNFNELVYLLHDKDRYRSLFSGHSINNILPSKYVGFRLAKGRLFSARTHEPPKDPLEL